MSASDWHAPAVSRRAMRAAPRPVAAALVVLCAAVAAAAEEAIDEIQVTATRRPVEASKVSAALTVIAAEEVRAAALVTDAFVGVPGVFRQQTTPGQGAAIVRGLKGSEVLHIVDGLRLNNAIFRNAPTQYLALVAPGSVERLEVVRGSPTSLYGSDAVGGVIQVISRMPSFETADAALGGELGLKLDTAERRRALKGALEFGNQRIAALVSGEYLETGDRRTGAGERIVPTGYESYGARAALVLTPDDSTRWLFDLQSGRQPETPRIDELVPGFGDTEAASSEFFFAPNERHFVHVGLAKDDGPLGLAWNADLGWQRIVDDRRSRDLGSDTRRLEDNASDLMGLAVTASRDGDRLSWIVGGEVYRDDVSSRRIEENVLSGSRTEVAARFPDGSTSAQAAVFGHATRDLGAGHSVNGGLRYSRIDVDIAATPLSPAAGLTLDDVSADVGWNYALTEGTHVVANLGYGFRSPNVFDLGTLGERPGNRFNVPNPDLESERATQIDAGIKRIGRAVSAELIAWYLHFEDRITSVETGELTGEGRIVVQSQNLAEADIWGLEATARYAFGSAAELDLVLNYTRGEQTDADGGTEPADRIPPLNGRLALRVFRGDSLTFGPYLLFAAGQDRLSGRDVRDGRIDPDGTPGWVTVNLQANWRPDGRWSLRFGLENVLDKPYRFHGSGIDAPGRNAFVQLERRW